MLVDWSADWCGPCKLIEPLLEELHDTGAVSVVKAKPELASNFLAWLRKKGRKYKVVALPTVILFADGVPTKTHVGRLSREQVRARALQCRAHAYPQKLRSTSRIDSSQYSALFVPPQLLDFVGVTSSTPAVG